MIIVMVMVNSMPALTWVHFQVGMMAGEAGKLSNQARFILEKCDGSLKVRKQSKRSHPHCSLP